MSDIVERLQNRERLCLEGIRPLVMACEEAAAEIARLRERNAEMLAALEFSITFKITDSNSNEVAEDSLHEIRKHASAAIAEAAAKPEVTT